MDRVVPQQHTDPLRPGDDLPDQFDHLHGQFGTAVGSPGHVSARTSQAGDEARADGVGDIDHHDGDARGRVLRGKNSGRRFDDHHIRLQRDEFTHQGRVSPVVAVRATHIDDQVLPSCVAKRIQGQPECPAPRRWWVPGLDQDRETVDSPWPLLRPHHMRTGEQGRRSGVQEQRPVHLQLPFSGQAAPGEPAPGARPEQPITCKTADRCHHIVAFWPSLVQTTHSRGPRIGPHLHPVLSPCQRGRCGHLAVVALGVGHDRPRTTGNVALLTTKPMS